MSEVNIYNDLLVSLVEARPVLWDKTLDIFKDRDATRKAWRGSLDIRSDFLGLLDGSKLNFNQLEGIFNSPLRKTPYKWRWSAYKVLEKQHVKELLRSMVSQEKQSTPILGKKVRKASSSGNKKITEEKKAEVDQIYESILAELPLPVARKSNVKSENHVMGFKSIIFKINEEMALRINGQDNIVINFFSNKVFHRIDLGVRVDPETVERIDELAPGKLGELPCVFDGLLHLSPSLQRINRELNPNSSNQKKSVSQKKRN